MKIALTLLGLSLLNACVPAKVESDVSSGNINVDAPYLWHPSAFPRPLKISDQFLTDEIDNITDMTTAWETAAENKKDFFNHGNDKATEVSTPNLNLDALGDDGVNGIYKITNWPQALPGGALAVTQIFGSRWNAGKDNEFVRIEHADILVNYHTYRFRYDDTFVNDTFDFRTVLLHELGHYLGLGHRYGDTIMVPSIGEGTKIVAPSSIDKNDIGRKYSLAYAGGTPAKVGMNVDQYKVSEGDKGEKVKILIELMASGECVHKVNGAVVKRHPAHIK